jgi:hypothetical protein
MRRSGSSQALAKETCIQIEDQANSKEEAVLTCFFDGTSSKLSEHLTQIGLFFDLAVGEDLSHKAFTRRDVSVGGTPESQGQYKMGFDGCGADYGCRGFIFGHGLKLQCRRAVARITEICACGLRVRLICLGLSRGAIAAMFLAQMVAEFSDVTVRLCLFDPVPGNLINTAKYLDPCRLTTANACKDLSQCGNLASVLALYPHEPLPDFAFHAPVFPRYPTR